MTDTLKTTGFKRGLVTNATAATTAPSAVSTTAPTDLIVTEGFRGCVIRFFGLTDNATMGVNIYGIETEATGGDPDSYTAHSLFTTTDTGIIIGTQAGVSGGLVPANNAYADTLGTVTTTAYATHRLNYIGGTLATHSPADNTFAEIAISDLSNLHGIVIRINAVSVDGNYLVKLDK